MKNKFTLIELLVVIAIIGILTTILIPSLEKLVKKQEELRLSRQKQLYLGSVIYGNDNNYYLQEVQIWRSARSLCRSVFTYIAKISI